MFITVINYSFSSSMAQLIHTQTVSHTIGFVQNAIITFPTITGASYSPESFIF